MVNSALLQTDFYKWGHILMYPPNTQQVFSTWTPRGTKTGHDKVVAFGTKYAVEKITNLWQQRFFDLELQDILDEFTFVHENALGSKPRQEWVDAITNLHGLSCLPLDIRALDEGTLVPLRTPYLTITNTDDRFGWLVNFLETALSSELWLSATSATTSYYLRKLVNDWAVRTGVDPDTMAFFGHDFSMRGMKGLESAAISGAGHLLSWDGSDNIGAIPLIHDTYQGTLGTDYIMGSVPACYDDKTEVLTENGFKLFADLDKGEKVAQYLESGEIQFVEPTEYYEDKYAGDMVHFKLHRGKINPDVDIMVTPNHRMVRRSIATGELSLFEARSDQRYSSAYKLPVSGIHNSGDDVFSPLDQLRVAFQADGSFSNRKNSYTGERTGTYPLRFSLKKERKKERLRNILDSLGYEYTWSEYDDGYASVRIASPIKLDKNFDWINLSDVSNLWCKSFVEELTHWDGSGRLSGTDRGSNTICFNSTCELSVNKVQAVGAISGFKTYTTHYDDKRPNHKRLRVYNVSFVEKEDIHTTHIENEPVKYDGFVYCVSVPSKMLIVRRNGCVAVCGNTEHSVMSAWGQDNEVELFEWLATKQFPDGMLSVVSDTWDFWNVLDEYLPQLKEEIMARNGKLVIRPDSGVPEDVLCGWKMYTHDEISEHIYNPDSLDDMASGIGTIISQEDENTLNDEPVFFEGCFEYEGKCYKCSGMYTWDGSSDLRYSHTDVREIWEIRYGAEQKGVVQALWDIFGGTTNDAGFKVLDSHIGVIYGEGMYHERMNTILQRLHDKGFASNNVVFGIGLTYGPAA